MKVTKSINMLNNSDIGSKISASQKPIQIRNLTFSTQSIDTAKIKKREPSEYSENMCYRLHRASILPEEYLSKDNRDKLFDVTFGKKDGEYLFMRPGVRGRDIEDISILDYDIEYVSGYTVKVSISPNKPMQRNLHMLSDSFAAKTIAKSKCCLCGEPCKKSGKVSVCKPSCLS